MFAVITTEEYKSLLNAQQEGEIFMMQLAEATSELRIYKENLEGLLNFLTSGQNPRWDEEYKSYDLIDNSKIADYINQNFLKDGKLNIKGNDNNDKQCSNNG